MEQFIKYPNYKFSLDEMGLYLALSKHINKQGECFPSIDRLCELSDLSRNTVCKIIKKFEKDNLLVKRLIKGHNVYRLKQLDKWNYVPYRFMDREDISLDTKLFILILEPYMLKEENWYSIKISFREIKRLMRIGEPRIHKIFSELINSEYYTEKDGFKYFDLKGMGLVLNWETNIELDDFYLKIDAIIKNLIDIKKLVYKEKKNEYITPGFKEDILSQLLEKLGISFPKNKENGE